MPNATSDAEGLGRCEAMSHCETMTYRFAVSANRPAHGRQRCGLTLLEMLVAVAASLLLLGTVMVLFQMVGEAVGQSRMMGVLDRQLCAVRTALLVDLTGATAARDENGLLVASPRHRGYFCVVEGPNTDYEEYLGNGNWFNRTQDARGPTADSDDRVVGDTDDMLLFTTQMITVIPFHGRYGTGSERSSLAEVAYFCRPTVGESNPRLYTLYRRQLLVVDSLPKPPFELANSARFINGNAWQGWADFLRLYDVSVRREGDSLDLASNRFVINSLDDLARRQNRLGHDWTLNKPAANAVRPDDGVWPLLASADEALRLSGSREGEDEIARNVLSFDVRVLDPSIMIRRSVSGLVDLQPGDAGYWDALPSLEREPRFVDLGYHRDPTDPADAASWFGRYGHETDGDEPKHPLTPADRSGPRTFDTWHPSQGRVPPYTNSLPAISVTIRLYDRTTRRIRQSTVSFQFTQN
jgi:type II secretory pathway component PulJ